MFTVTIDAVTQAGSPGMCMAGIFELNTET